jgi:hypothetical protein
MLIGDWDRHYDQWRWAEYKNKLFTGLFHVTETRLSQNLMEHCFQSVFRHFVTLQTLRH